LSDFKSVFDRLKQYFGLSSNKKVCEKIGLNYETMKSWSTRKKVVVETLMDLMKDEPINYNWLLNGIGDPRISEADRLLDDISKMAWSLNNSPIDVELIKKLGEHSHIVELIELLPYAPDEFIINVLERLRKFKELSKL
jgi:hypothetical protein